MKRAFLTGLALFLPLVLTLLVARGVIRFITKPLVGIVSWLLAGLQLQPDLLYVVSQLIALILFLLLLIGIGFFANLLFFRWIFDGVDHLFHRIPLIRSVYKAFKDVARSLMQREDTPFEQVVLVPYPSEEALALAVVTQTVTIRGEKRISVLVPGTPNPTMGFVLLFREEDVRKIDMPVSKAFQAIVSCGSKIDSFNILSNDQRNAHHQAPK